MGRCWWVCVSLYPTRVVRSSPCSRCFSRLGGYCGSWASQRALLAKGAWISQQQVRDHTSPCGGHDNEILSCNIEEAWTALKVDFDSFNAPADEPLPQTNAYFAWLKKNLAAGHTVAWM